MVSNPTPPESLDAPAQSQYISQSMPPASDGPYTYPPYPPVYYPPYPPEAGYPPASVPASMPASMPTPYAYPPYPWMYAPAPRLGTWALVSMICGVVSIVSFQSILAVLAIVFGFVGLNEVKKSAGTVEGRGFAIAGIVTGFISVAITLVIIALYVLYFIFLLSLYQTIPG